jgi:Domain of unknown function (DUF4291)
MLIRTERYTEQATRWPKAGRHILAQFDADTVVVYQAYAPAIGRFAAEHGWFGGSFSYSRMSWIKPNFLWMMYRCGWGTKDGQQVVLAVHLAREGFDAILKEAVHSAFTPEVYASPEAWNRRVQGSGVRLQWDPDHEPHGGKLERRAIQLGLRGEFLRRYGKEWIVRIEDVTELVAEQHEHVSARRLDLLLTPEEHVYPVSDAEVAQKLGIDA